MGLIVDTYKKNFLQRYDKDAAIPYYSPEDFPGLVCEEGVFRGGFGADVRYYFYGFPGYEAGKLILFCPGMGPGHAAYLAEIVTLCRAGLRVLTLDYTGCGASGGERLPSVNAPARDAMGLLELLRPEAEIIPVGHSLGGYTALNLARMLPEVRRAVVISGFVDIVDEMTGFLKFRPLAWPVGRFERKLDPELGDHGNLSYLRTTEDWLLWIHSTDDPMVNYRRNAGRVAKAGNPNIRLITAEGKKHNPQYTSEALRKMNEWIGGYNRFLSENKTASPEERKAYFADKPIGGMTEQDPEVWGEILKFIAD